MSFINEIENKLFDNINDYSLDFDQRKIIVDNSKNLLVVAGAGSGKTLTIIGKIKYLINIKKVKPEEILCISFTNETVNNLKNKIDLEVDIFTFHKLGLEILKDYNYYYKIASSDLLDFIVNEYFESNLFYEDKLSFVLNYFRYYLKDNNLTLDRIKKEFNNLFQSYKKLIIKFINLIKSNDYSIEDIRKCLKNNKYILSSKKRLKNKIFFIIMFDIYNIYLNELYSSFQIDFDMIIKTSSKLIKKYGMKKYYKYIIIDEWQDTSMLRFNLIKAIQDECDSNIFCVGDDFQSIYKFSGCTMDLFVNFKKYFEKSKVMYLHRTYRNSMELIKIAYHFIIKNHYQLSKMLLSNKRLNKPIKLIYYTRSNYQYKFNKLLELLCNNNDKEVLVLGRCHYDINKVYSDELVKQPEKNIRFLTVHASKGLESDNVIILNLSDEMLGFPNKIEDDEVLKLFFKNKERILYAEERRLFYVALTRTKNNVYLMVKKNHESIFVKEIINKCEILDI